jgi:hypothetical protein
MTPEDIISNSESTLVLNVFGFPYIPRGECEQMVSIALQNTANVHHGSMQKYTIDVVETFGQFIKEKLLLELTPSINKLFYFGEENQYQVYTAHVICYSSAPPGEKSLKLHVDDSDITVNITLEANDLDGCEVEFFGTTEYGNNSLRRFERLRNKIHPEQGNRIQMDVGRCMIHRGNHPHQTLPIRRGTRKALIVWLKKV